MVYGAIDLHVRYSQIRVIDADGRVMREQRIPTTRERLTAAFAGLGPVRILLETGTESEWVAQTLEAAGHPVIVADPNYAPMYGEVRRRVKTDRRDVAALAEANRRGWYRLAYRRSAPQRALQQILRTRRHLVAMRSGTISLLRSVLRQEGYRLPSGAVRRSRPGWPRSTSPRRWRDAGAIAPDHRGAERRDRGDRCASPNRGAGRCGGDAAAERAGGGPGGRRDVSGHAGPHRSVSRGRPGERAGGAGAAGG